ncbi:HesA/MoeB/ThiF family protein [Pajaroellobacter abortibovis]|uniref:Molybdopterin-synthase adenylyltransferase n=1 Tax=Pajaroellobacter abortibovis TaxID=1882918 RepID=A0A1L6MW23_9BACT|nr:HesA/MoeB/ThiF family protein [Pajaroellobacter abortibovis]APR99749.1 hypothetical protein BCY86_02960 [Pajaroellobacter abortibovis]
MSSSFSAEELLQYSQHFKLKEIGEDGQAKLKQARVLCIGAGGLGSPLLLYLAAAGVGTLGVLDEDRVELSNLPRQILFPFASSRQKKVHVIQRRLRSINPHVCVHGYAERLTLANAEQWIQAYDIVADCTDNFETHYLVNDVCFYLNKPYVSASIAETKGQISSFLDQEGPCLRCLFPYHPTFDSVPNCTATGVFNVLPGLLGIIQATEIMKWILGVGHLLCGRLLTVNILNMRFNEFFFGQNPNCELCVHRHSLEQLIRPSSFPATIHSIRHRAITAKELKKRLENRAPLFLLDVRTPEEHQVDPLGGYLIPLDELSYRLQEVDTTIPVIVYCRSGARSQKAVELLLQRQRKGEGEIYFLTGGLMAWYEESRNRASWCLGLNNRS